MDETKTRWYRWTANNAKHFPWIIFGVVFGLFASHLVGVLEAPAVAVIAVIAFLAIALICCWPALRKLVQRNDKVIVALGTVSLAILAFVAWREAIDATHVFENQLRVMRDGQRPWVSIEISVGGITWGQMALLSSVIMN